jgi:hypothetical protein
MWTTVLEPFKAVISTRFAEGYKRRPVQTMRENEELAAGIPLLAGTVEEKTLVNQEGNGITLRQSSIVSCYK